MFDIYMEKDGKRELLCNCDSFDKACNLALLLCTHNDAAESWFVYHKDVLLKSYQVDDKGRVLVQE